MSDSKKRKALDQLSPYSQQEEETVNQTNEVTSQPVERPRRRARANITKLKGTIGETSTLKGILPSFSILSQPENEDKISGLNRCFLNAVTRVVKKQSKKDLRDLFKQYELFINKIIENNYQ